MCKDWKENIEKVNGPIMLQAARQNTKGYDGVLFKYCPWCASEMDNGECNASVRV
ncbi:hypothetical protein LCGC14_1621430 [marine sediment metagenome]|uniref:Uncharacterized protein n=1 Tax=marine sediment metagenome TaxID=412755 RepID=A0A0F9L5B5_9ZZZZ